MQQKNRQMIRWRKNKEDGKEGERRTEADEGCVCVTCIVSQTGRGSWFCFAPGRTEC